MFVLLAGGGRTAAQLATLLLAQNHRVRVLEARPDVRANLRVLQERTGRIRGRRSPGNVHEISALHPGDNRSSHIRRDANHRAANLQYRRKRILENPINRFCDFVQSRRNNIANIAKNAANDVSNIANPSSQINAGLFSYPTHH